MQGIQSLGLAQAGSLFACVNGVLIKALQDWVSQ